MSAHLEGRMSVMAALQAGRRRIESIWVRNDAEPGKFDEVLELAKKKKVPVRQVAAAELDTIAHAKTHGGLIAMTEPRPSDTEKDVDAILAAEKAPFLLLLEGIDDDRNLGFTLRTAEALGVHAVIVKRRDWDVDETGVSRSSAGAFERMCIVRTDREDGLLERLKSKGFAIWGCVPNVMGTIHQADLKGPIVLAVGGEKRGLSGAVRGLCTGFMRIPMKPGVTSLSMSHAAAIAMAEVVRQRLS